MAADPLDHYRADEALSHLKGFQRDAAEYAFQRLFTAPDSTRRFLIADEVGLGKTVIARGVLARTLEHLRSRVPRIDVVYICSNQRIAGQNISRLNPVRDQEFASAERITLLPVHLQDLSKRRVNFVAFTPGTSLDLKGSLGVRQERLLLHALLEEHWGLSGVAALNVLQGGVQNTERFRSRAREYRSNHDIAPDIAEAFCRQLDQAAGLVHAAGRPDLRSRFLALCEGFSRQDSVVSKELRQERNQVVGELRAILAKTCIAALEPDLVILDEFQRFKNLLAPDSEQGELARHLFDWQDEHTRARVLLLSATPYKAYTLQHELAEENHYADFVKTFGFLINNNKRVMDDFCDLLNQYRQALYCLRDSGGATLIDLKAKIEAHLRRVMSRTERLAVAGESNGMLRTNLKANLQVTAADLQAYSAVKKIADCLKVDDAIEYWKSAAYPVNFMEGYQLKQALEGARKRPGADLVEAVRAAQSVGLPYEAIQANEPVPLPNAPLRDLVAALERDGAFAVLWLPPTLPYYPLSGDFARATPQLTKRLIFSAWNLVPRSLAALLSYEAERRAVAADESDPAARSQAHRPKSGLLRFGRSDHRLVGLPLFTLLFPCRTLAEACDPREYRRQVGAAPIVPDAVLAWAEQRVRMLLPAGVTFAEPGQAADEAWYWMAPLLLDSQRYPAATDAWWGRSSLDREWVGSVAVSEVESAENIDQGWREHVEAAKQAARAAKWSDGKAPSDLVRTLALVGLAAPATCALRALLRLYPITAAGDDSAQRLGAAQIGWAFRALFNRPESTALIRKGSRGGYWSAILEYAYQGCLASVLDEYAHVLRDATGVTLEAAAKGCASIAKMACAALQIRTATLDVDRPVVEPGSESITLEKRSMRALFAMRFGTEKTDDQQQVQRDSAVAAAFNSPFWPFVLATTSVGQEGLDFHWYCHAVVHWNLPSNPVDLEQREGRVHRFKGHAVRKNVASRCGLSAIVGSLPDPWDAAFQIAAEGTPPGHRGLLPYWLYPLPDGAFIERYVSVFPLSRDEGRYKALQRSLGAYRMVFGQPRQDELLAYLVDYVEPTRLLELAALLRIDLAPPTCELSAARQATADGQ